VKVGDMVKMRQGYSAPGLVVDFVVVPRRYAEETFVRVLWSDDGMGFEKLRDLKIISEGNKNK